MDHTDDEQQQQALALVLLRAAQDRLHAGASPEAVFAELAVNTRDVRAAAIAVCVAAGTSRADAEKRWVDDGEPLLAEVQGDGEAAVGQFLEMAGFFDFHRPLDEREQQISRHLSQAFNAYGRWRSGVAHQLSRKMQTGQFVDALALMAAQGSHRSVPTPSAYWTHLLAAANMLTGSDSEIEGENSRVESVVLLCRQRL